MPQPCSMKNGKYIQYSRIFHTFACVKTLPESPCPIVRCCPKKVFGPALTKKGKGEKRAAHGWVRCTSEARHVLRAVCCKEVSVCPAYDRLLETVPTNLAAKMFHFPKEEFFEVEEAEKAKVTIKF